MKKARGGLRVKAGSVWASLLGMTAGDVRAAKEAGVKVEEIFLFWRGRKREEFERLYGGFPGMDQYLKMAFIDVSGGVIQLRSQVVEMKKAKETDGEKEQEKAHSDAPEK